MLKYFRALVEKPIGGKLNEKVLLYLLNKCYQSRFNSQWKNNKRLPHFEEQRIFFFNFVYSDHPMFTGISPFFRGFWSSEVIQDGDQVLDIGCGDGFFSMRFLSEKASHVDAIDLDHEAIARARLQNCAQKTEYHCFDATNASLPCPSYDVIVWDSSIGHFSRNSTEGMLKKICRHLKPEGIFVGSESLGPEGHDHLQEFDSLDDIVAIFQPFFKYICVRERCYPLSWAGNYLRREAFWRCSNDLNRIHTAGWKLIQNK